MKVFTPFQTNLLLATMALYTPLAFGAHQDLFELSLETLMTIPISGSTLHDETKQSVPSAVSVFNRAQIEKLGVETLAELANLSPGFQVLRNGDNSGYTAISSRGRRISAKSAEILLLVDGKRVHDARVSGIVSLLEFPLFAVERVEFIRGPGAALYGSGAMMGVINVITRSGIHELEAHAGNNNVQLHLAGGRHGRYGELEGLLSHRTSDGQEYTLPDSFTGAPIETRDPYQTTNAIVKYSHGRWNAQVQFAEQVYQEFYSLEVVDPDVSKFDQTFWSISLSHECQSDNITHSTGISVSGSENKTQARFTPPGVFAGDSNPSSGDPSIALSDFQAAELELTHQTQIDLNTQNLLTFGITANHQEITKDTLYKNFLNIGDTDNNNRNNYLSSPNLAFRIDNYNITEETYTGLFGQWQWQTKSAGEVTMGARHDYYYNIKKQHFSPRLAWVYSLPYEQSFKLLYSQAFRAPNLHEIGVVPNGFISSNPDLKPETVSTAEIIWLGSSPHFLWSLGYFYNTFEDPILLEVGSGVLSSGERTYANSRHSDINGLEAELQFNIGNFLCSANATHILKTDDIAYRESTELMSFSINYHHGYWNFNLAAAYRGERGSSIVQQDALDSYWLSAAKIRYRLLDGIELIAQAKNLADDEIYYPTQGSIAADGIASRGREYSIGLRWTM